MFNTNDEARQQDGHQMSVDTTRKFGDDTQRVHQVFDGDPESFKRNRYGMAAQFIDGLTGVTVGGLAGHLFKAFTVAVDVNLFALQTSTLSVFATGIMLLLVIAGMCWAWFSSDSPTDAGFKFLSLLVGFAVGYL